MTQSKSETYLKEAMSEGKLIPLVGAGVSMAITDKHNNRVFPSWTELLEKAVEEIDVDERDLIKGFIKRGRLLEAAREARDSITGDLWFNFIRAQFDPKLDECEQSSFDLPKAIWKLSNQVITLNYDRVMNYASNASNTSIIKNSSPAQISKMQSPSNDKMIWHLHGHIDEPENLVLTPKSYETLYNNEEEYQAAIQALKNILSTRSLIFIGCSMNDFDLLKKLGEQNKLFSGNTKLHFVLIKESEKEKVKEKLKDFNTIKLITYSEHGQPLIDEIDRISELGKNSSHLIKTSINPSIQSYGKDKIAYLKSNPFGSNINYPSLEMVLNRKLPFDLDTFYLSETKLQDLNDYTYLLIACEIRKDKLVIENDWCGSQLLPIHKIKDNLALDNLKGVILICDKLPDRTALEQLDLPIIFVPELNGTKTLLKNLWFNLFRKQSFEYLENDCILHNISKFEITSPLKTMSGKSKETIPSLPREISNDDLKNFIGRQQDLEDCSRKLVEAKENGEFLSIVGAGGLGKTSLAQKIALEFNKRNVFDKGVIFIDCESLNSAQQFHRFMAGAFGLNDALDFINHLKNNSELYKGDRLIIIDNAESLLNLQDKSQVIDIISNTSEFATLLLTSREHTKLNLESTYLLRDFITDEAFQLFEKKSNQKFNNYEKDFLKKFILKELLDNNPLAISLVAPTMIVGKDVKVLKKELEDNFFELTKNESDYFKGNENNNVDRKSSIYNSIDYSYRSLRTSQKEALIKLSYFPDGIDLESFKRTTNINTNGLQSSPIRDSTIKSLQDKSLVKNSRKHIKLHPLVLRFSKDKININEEEIYLESVFSYNYQFAKLLSDMTFSPNLDKQLRSRNTTYTHLNNFSLILEKLNKNIDQHDSAIYAYRVASLFSEVGAFEELYTGLSKSINKFKDEGNIKLLLNVVLIAAKYFLGDFKRSYRELKEILPIKKWLELDNNDDIESRIFSSACSVYGNEGHVDDILSYNIEINHKERFYDTSLKDRGFFDLELAEVAIEDATTLYVRHALGKLDINKFNEVWNSIHRKDYISKALLLTVKYKIAHVEDHEIDEILVVNPYTKGTKNLLKAIHCNENDDAILLFKLALNDLKHIKFAYTSALLEYAVRLRKIGHEHEFNIIYNEGLDLSIKYKFDYLHYCFLQLFANNHENFNNGTYTSSNTHSLDMYIRNNVRHCKTRKK